VKRTLALGLAFLLCCCGEGEMAVQPKYKPYRPAQLFNDNASNQAPPDGTVARGAFAKSVLASQRPAMSAELLARGQERYDIFCAPCHGRDGDGNGLVPQRGYPHPRGFHEDRLRNASDRYFIDIIAGGYGAMFSYAARVPPADRWAIVAYIRALQLSQNVPATALSADDRRKMEAAAP
jgi:mono/diheme cytochrome c family protein